MRWDSKRQGFLYGEAVSNMRDTIPVVMRGQGCLTATLAHLNVLLIVPEMRGSL